MTGLIYGVVIIAVLVIIALFRKRRGGVPKDIGFPEVRRRQGKINHF